MADGPVATEIRNLLTRSLAPARLDIDDDSARHAGHHHHGGVDARPGGESHFNVLIVSEAFAGRSRLERQRLVMSPLGDLLAGPVHALSIKALTPAEADAS